MAVTEGKRYVGARKAQKREWQDVQPRLQKNAPHVAFLTSLYSLVVPKMILSAESCSAPCCRLLATRVILLVLDVIGYGSLL